MGLFDIFGNDAQERSAQSQIAGINAGQSQATNYLTNGLNLAQGSYAAGLQPYQQILSQLRNGPMATGANAYADAVGVNGADGNARAVQNFQSNPG